MRDATFAAAAGSTEPVTLDLDPGERAALHRPSEYDAAVVALLAAGIVKASSGTVLIGDFDPRVQPVHCKRAAALVPHEPFALDESEFQRYVAYRAALWNVDAQRAFARAHELRARLTGVHEAFAYPLIGALIGEPRLVVLDRPQSVYAAKILSAISDAAVISTHADAASALAFS